MAFIFGTASNEGELYKVVRDFLAGRARPGQVTFSGAGTGLVNNLLYPDSSDGVFETFTLTCQNSAVRGGSFSVVGSVTGVMPDATVGQTYKHAKVEFYLDFGDVDFEVGDAFTITCGTRPAGTPVFVELKGGSELATETLTLVCTVAGQQQIPGVQPFIPAQFSVTGSVSGALPNLTQGVLYDNPYLRARLLTVPLSATQFQLDDEIQLAFTQNPLRALDQHWEILRKSPSVTDQQFGQTVLDMDSELIMKGPGLSGDDEIFWGMTRTWSDANAAASWTHYGMTGYIPSMPINEQSGVQGGQSGVRPVHTFWSLALPYVLIASGRCFKLLTRSNIYYSQSYQGLFLPYTLPVYYGYPYFSGGTGTSSNTMWSSLPSDRSSFWNFLGSESNVSSGVVLTEAFGWTSLYGDSSERNSTWSTNHNQNGVSPFTQHQMYDLRSNLNGEVPLFRAQMTPNRGELDGVYAVPGRDGRQPEEILVNRDGSRAYVVQNHHRSGFNDFCAFLLN